MKKYKLTISFDGSVYSGWQIQPTSISIQSLIQNALNVILREPISLIGASRTDAGVHACGQVAHFQTIVSFNKDKLLYSLNGILPKDIRIKKIEEVDLSFHARYQSLSKTYHYHLSYAPNPFNRLYALSLRRRLDFDLIKEACSYFVGKHDFTSFANDAKEGAAKNKPVKTMIRLDPVLLENGLRLEFEADGFLYKMVRTIVGTLIQIAHNKKPIRTIRTILEAKDRRLAGPAAPPHGLFLIKVRY